MEQVSLAPGDKWASTTGWLLPSCSVSKLRVSGMSTPRISATCTFRAAMSLHMSRGTSTCLSGPHCTTKEGLRKPSDTGHVTTRKSSQPPISSVRSSNGDGSLGNQQQPGLVHCKARVDNGQATARCDPSQWPLTTPLALVPNWKTTGVMLSSSKVLLASVPAAVLHVTWPCNGTASSGTCDGSADSQTHARRASTSSSWSLVSPSASSSHSSSSSSSSVA
mmetsp:Transcript_53560/g.148536  ORF Transcript_53560/g.148536 Transcript_53560/m.148536 type:complete len:221 (-) Transcript_53560:1398-2060(-)